jgi:hypothetical protein
MRILGEERLAQHIRITEMSTQKFWKELSIPKRIQQPGQFIMWTACKCFPHLSRVIWRENDGTSIKTKDRAVKAIGKYLMRVKMVVKLITEYTYGVRVSDKVVSKRDRLFEPTDLLDMCGMSKSWRMTHWMVPKFVSRQLRWFCHCSITSTSIIPIRCHIQMKKLMRMQILRWMWKCSDDQADDLEEGTVEQGENEPWFNSTF